METEKVYQADEASKNVEQKVTHIPNETPSGELDPNSPRKSWRAKWILNPLKRRVPPVPTERRTSPEDAANVFSMISFDWMNHILSVGYRRTLTDNDFPHLSKSRRTVANNDKIMEELRRRAERGDKHPLFFSLLHVFGREYWLAGFCQLLSTSIQGVAPILLKVILKYASDAYYGEAAPIGRGVGFVLVLIAMLTVAAFSINQWVFRGLMSGGMARASLISLIYSKSLVISNRAKAGVTDPNKDYKGKPLNKNEDNSVRVTKSMEGHDSQGWSNGRVINLMSTDTAHIDQATMWSHMLWTIPLQLCIVITLLIINIGVSALAGLALFVAMMPLLARSARSLATRRKDMQKITDQRLGVTQEILQSMRFVKFFSWEASFLEQLRDMRKKEIRAVQVLLAIRSALNAFSVVGLDKLPHHRPRY